MQILVRVYIFHANSRVSLYFPCKFKGRSIFFHANSKVGLYFSMQIQKWAYIFHANLKLGLYSVGVYKLHANISMQIFFRVYIFPCKYKRGSIFFHANLRVGLYFSMQIKNRVYIFPCKFESGSIFFHANTKVGLYFPCKFESGSIFSMQIQMWVYIAIMAIFHANLSPPILNLLSLFENSCANSTKYTSFSP